MKPFGSVLVGGGAAALGPLIWAASNGQLDEWRDEGLALLERTSSLGGTIGRYQIQADTRASTFIECVFASDRLAALRDAESTVRLRQLGSAYPPLPLVGAFMADLGREVQSWFDHPACSLNLSCEATEIHLKGPDLVSVGSPRGEILARSAVIALGGEQILPNFPEFRDPAIRSKLMTSDTLLASQSDEVLHAIFRTGRERVVIIGASHSAFSAASVLLRKYVTGEGALRLLYRRLPPVFYDSTEEAAADGYAFTEDDICPFTKRVNRIGGIRNDGKEVWRRVTCRPGAAPEPRMRMTALQTLHASERRQMLEEAALIIGATGYRMRMPPIYDVNGRPVATSHRVDAQCRVLLEDGTSLPNIFGIGLGSGFQPWGKMAGEKSFSGQQNSLWLFQHGVGELVCNGVRHLGAAAPARVNTLVQAIPFASASPIDLPLRAASSEAQVTPI